MSYFSRIGKVNSVELARGLDGLSKGFAFVNYERPQDVGYAVEKFDNTVLDGRTIHVEFSSKRKRFIMEKKFEASEAVTRIRQAEQEAQALEKERLLRKQIENEQISKEVLEKEQQNTLEFNETPITSLQTTVTKNDNVYIPGPLEQISHDLLGDEKPFEQVLPTEASKPPDSSYDESSSSDYDQPREHRHHRHSHRHRHSHSGDRHRRHRHHRRHHRDNEG